jgi:hypothetical protein
MLVHVYLHYIRANAFWHDCVMFRQACGNIDGNAEHLNYLYNKCGLNLVQLPYTSYYTLKPHVFKKMKSSTKLLRAAMD